jgi:microcystin-dependent protein
MSEPFIGEIMMVGFQFAPRDWAVCDGQTIEIDQNQALFALIGANFGGDGQRNYKLPDLRGRVPVHSSTFIRQGKWGGAEQVPITEATFAEHTHAAMASTQNADIPTPGLSGRAYGKTEGNNYLYRDPSNLVSLYPDTVTNSSGGSLPHNNLQPSLVVKYIIAMDGLFPSRS